MKVMPCPRCGKEPVYVPGMDEYLLTCHPGAAGDALDPPRCPRCKDEGVIRFINAHPEDYEPPVPCPNCQPASPTPNREDGGRVEMAETERILNPPSDEPEDQVAYAVQAIHEATRIISGHYHDATEWPGWIDDATTAALRANELLDMGLSHVLRASEPTS